MKLRIFEPRYKRLVKEASQRDGTFGICLFEKEGEGSSLSCVGTQAKIVDFELLDDGLLGLTVIGMKRFMIQRVKTEFDGLRVANVEWLPSWDVVDIEDRHQFIVDHLRQVYQQFPQLGEMYDQCFFDDASWVTQRWLELLPIPKSQFDFLLLQSDCSTAMEFLSQSIEP